MFWDLIPELARHIRLNLLNIPSLFEGIFLKQAGLNGRQRKAEERINPSKPLFYTGQKVRRYCVYPIFDINSADDREQCRNLF